jgi:hypothetical protein
MEYGVACNGSSKTRFANSISRVASARLPTGAEDSPRGRSFGSHPLCRNKAPRQHIATLECPAAAITALL